MKVKFKFALVMTDGDRLPVTIEYDKDFYGDEMTEDDAALDIYSLRFIPTDDDKWVNPRHVKYIDFLERTEG